MKSLLFLIPILLFLVTSSFFPTELFAEQFTILCNNYSPEDSVHYESAEIIDSLLQEHRDVFVVSPFPFSDHYERQICFFNPVIFFEPCSDTSLQILSSNVQSSDSLFYDLIPFMPAVIDTHTVVFISVTTPDFPHLYRKYSADLSVQIDIFERTNKFCRVFKNFGIDHIIAINYLGDYLSKELLNKCPELDLVIDYFSLDNNHHYMKEITHPQLVNWSRKKEHLLLIDVEFQNNTLLIKSIDRIE